MKTFHVVFASALVAVSVGIAARSESAPRTWTGGHFVLELGGVQAGEVTHLSGGAVSADVVTEKAGPNYFVKKHIGRPRYEDFSFRVGAGMSKALYEWLSATTHLNYVRHDGSFVTLDHNNVEKSRRGFNSALLTEIDFPQLDASSKDPALLTIKFSPEYTRFLKGSGRVTAIRHQKQWLASAFRVVIPGVDTSTVARVEPIVFKLGVKTDKTGAAVMHKGHAELSPTPVDFGVFVASSREKSFADWMKRGNARTGAVEMLTSDKRHVLFVVTLKGLRVVGIKSRAAGQVRVELRATALTFEAKPASWK